jgi:hypothetical protein
MQASATRTSNELASLIADRQSAGDMGVSSIEAFRVFDAGSSVFRRARAKLRKS